MKAAQLAETISRYQHLIDGLNDLWVFCSSPSKRKVLATTIRQLSDELKALQLDYERNLGL